MALSRVLALTACALALVLPAGVADAALISEVEYVAGNNTPPELSVGGFGEWVLAFTDRDHRWMGASGEPSVAELGLAGADYILTANDDRAISQDSVAYRVTFAEDVEVYLFLDLRVNNGNPLPWMSDLGFTRSPHEIGVDEGGTGSVNRNSSILVAELAAGTYEFFGQDQGGTNNYGIVAVPEPATLALVGLGALALIRRRR